MPWIKVSKEFHRDMKEYLVDIEDLSLGQLIEACFEYALQNLRDFEDFLGLHQETEEEETETDKAAEEEEAEEEHETEEEEREED